jgi:hypothetical protein
LEPVARGLHITHWSSADLARQAIQDGILASISPRSVRRVSREVDPQPHRTRFWKSAALNAALLERAEKVLRRPDTTRARLARWAWHSVESVEETLPKPYDLCKL